LATILQRVKKTKHNILTADDFLLTTQSDNVAILQGLIISTATLPKNSDGLKVNFRTDTFGVILVLTGEVQIKINLMEYTLKKDDLLVSSPNSLKQMISFSSNFSFLFVGFTGHAISWLGILGKNTSVLMDFFSRKYTPHWKLEQSDVTLLKTLADGVQQRIQSFSTHPYGKELLTHSFYVLLYELAALSKKYTQAINFHLSRKEDLILRFANLVAQHFRSQRNVQAYGRQLNVTPKYLTEAVKEISGKTAGEIIDDFVILEAKVLLADPALSVAQVAQELSFSDQSFFGKFFKRHVGLSPRQYKNANTGNAML
jgi:AraC-like DNA-binding protein